MQVLLNDVFGDSHGTQRTDFHGHDQGWCCEREIGFRRSCEAELEGYAHDLLER
jgi:hypothetical protein